MLEYYQPFIDQMGSSIDLTNFDNPEIYGNYLAQTYYYVSHSTRMLAFSAGLMKQNEDMYFRRFLKHINEEYSHETLAESDLNDLGMRPYDFSHLPETRALWEPQYYKIQHENPLSLLGYIIALEGFASAHLPRLLKRIEKVYKGKACRFINLHIQEDSDHLEKAAQLTSTLSSKLQEFVLINVIQTARSYTAMVKSCETSFNYKLIQR